MTKDHYGEEQPGINQVSAQDKGNTVQPIQKGEAIKGEVAEDKGC